MQSYCEKRGMQSLSIALTLALLGYCATLCLCNESNEKFLRENAKRSGVIELPSGLQYKAVKSVKSGMSPNRTSNCHVHYRGTTLEKVEFDNSRKRGSRPTQFRPSDVIAGWREALMLMKEGEVWELTIPPKLAYGKRGAGKQIKPDAVLQFKIELIKVDMDDSSWFKIPPWVTNIPTFAWLLVAYFLYVTATGAGWNSPARKLNKVALEDVKGSLGNEKVFMDICVSGMTEGLVLRERIEIELFSSLVPKTSANFLHLCTGDRGLGKCGKRLHYKDSFFHRVIPGFMAQGGDFERGNGTGGESVYGGKFDDEFELGYVPHSEPYLLSMANKGSNTNSSQFFITFTATPHLDGKHVVFGRVLESSKGAMRLLEKYGSPSGKPKAVLQVTDCGELKDKAE